MLHKIFQVYSILCDSVAEKLAQQLQYRERKQMIFEMMGLEFVLKYFSGENYDPDILVSLSIIIAH